MALPRKLFLSSVSDDELTFFHVAPKVARPFPHRKSLLYALICLLWLLFGIVGRDAWKPHETLLVGVIAELLSGRDALALADVGLEHYPAFYPQLAALAAAALPWLPLHEGARLINILLLGGGFVCIWLAGKRAYGIGSAWLALLLLVGCFGFMVRAHQLSFGVPAFFGMSLAVLAAAILTDENRPVNQVFVSGCLSGLGGAFLLLTCGLLPAFIALAVAAAATKNQRAVFIIILLIFFAPLLMWMYQHDMIRLPLIAARFQSLTALAEALHSLLSVALWSLLPLLPICLYGLWHTRGQGWSPLKRYLLFAVAGGGLLFLLHGSNEEDYYFILPPLALLAVHYLRKMPDGTAGVMDSFAVVIIGFCVVGGLWLYWGVLYWQAPQPLLMKIHETFPGYALPPVHGGKVALAALLTAGWMVLMLNFGRNNERAVVNWSCGITLVWVVFNLLLIGYVDSGKSYRRPVMQLQQLVAGDCVESPAGKHWRAQLVYYGVNVGGADCPYYLSSEEIPAQTALLFLARSERDAGYYLYSRF